jgi:hypothetical protein
MRIRIPILILTFTSLVSFVSAFIGFGQVPDGYSLSTRVYLALQLFTFQCGDVEGAVPLGVEVARWLAPATTLGGVYAAAHAFFARLWGSLRLRWIRGHTIICGGGEKGSALAVELASSGDASVVVVDPAESEDWTLLRREGVLVLRGSGGDAEAMAQAGLARAASLVCLTGDDRTNIGMALAAIEMLPVERSAEPLEIHAHVADVGLRNILQRNQLLDMKSDRRHRISLFNCHASRARLTFAANPLEGDSHGGLHGNVHLVVGALDPAEKALVVHAAQIGHFRDGGKVKVHLVSVRAKADEALLLKEYPGFRRCAELEASVIAENDDFVERVAELAAGWNCDSVVTVLLGGAAESALAEGLLLIERLKVVTRLRVLLDAADDSPIRILVGKNPVLATRIRFLPPLLEAVGKDVVFQNGLDAVARRIHETWKCGTDDRIVKAEAVGDLQAAAKHREKDTYRGWEDLTEEQKDVNRLTADHIAVKFRSVGIERDSGPSLRSAWDGLDAQQLDMLCRMEHERWAAPLWMAGWTAGERNDVLGIHPNLVPYDELDEGTRDYDLEQVKMAASYWLGM